VNVSGEGTGLLFSYGSRFIRRIRSWKRGSLRGEDRKVLSWPLVLMYPEMSPTNTGRGCAALTYCLSKTSTLLKGLPSALVPIVLKVRVFLSGETERMKTVINFPSFMDIPSRL